MGRSTKSWLPGVLFTAVLVLAEVLFMALLISTKLLPAKFLVLIAVVCLLFSGLVYFLTRDARKGRQLIGGTVLIGVLVIGIAFGSSYIYQGVDTLDTITQTKIELADVAFYVMADDPAESLQEASEYTFGILSAMDRENTNKALEQISEILGRAPMTREYAGVSELVDSILTTGETQAIVMNKAFFGLLTEMEGYENSSDQLKSLHTVSVETEIEVKKSGEGANGSEVEEAQHSGSVFSVYISGIDSRGTISTVSRSDVNIIATVNTDTHQVLLVSTPRDYYVPLSISNGVPDKLTHAGIYGIKVSVNTLEMLYDTTIDYYFRVNFSGFEDIIDALNGINVNSEFAFTADDHSYVVGENQLNGEAALAFARERYAFENAGGDRQRGKNQMEVIKAVINKALSPALLANYSGILQGVSDSFESSMPYDTLAELVRNQLDSGASWNIVTYSVDGTGASEKPYSLSTTAYVMVPDTNTVNHAIELMNKVKNGEILTQE